MAFRDTLLANVTSAFAGSNISVSSELPWVSGGVPLYEKNMKVFYLGEEQLEIVPLESTLDSNDVYSKQTTLTGFITVDAKNQPGDMANVVSSVINSRLSISNQFVNECVTDTEVEEDRLTYTFEYRFLTLN